MHSSGTLIAVAPIDGITKLACLVFSDFPFQPVAREKSDGITATSFRGTVGTTPVRDIFHGPSILVDGANTSPELGRMLIFWQSRCDISGPAMSFQCGVCQGDLDTLSQSVFFNAFLRRGPWPSCPRRESFSISTISREEDQHKDIIILDRDNL